MKSIIVARILSINKEKFLMLLLYIYLKIIYDNRVARKRGYIYDGKKHGRSSRSVY